MLNDERGVIKNIDRARQINDFSGLRFGNITPTDLDGLIEYQNKLYVLFEVKYKDAEMPYGQRLALERMCNDFQTAGKRSVVLLVEHDIKDTNLSVDVANCCVRQVYFNLNEKWRKPKYAITTKEACDKFIGNQCIETEPDIDPYDEQIKSEFEKIKLLVNDAISLLENKLEAFLNKGR